MSERTIADKLQLKPGQRIAAINPPGDYGALIGGLPAAVTLLPAPSPEADVVHLFVRDRAELAREWPVSVAALRDDALLWVSYPKRGPGVVTDLTRDVGWSPVRESGFDPVSQVAIDATWSALRWRRDPALRAAREARGARVGRD